MGTRSMIYVLDCNNRCYCSLYTQYDGYPQQPGVGWEIYNFLCGRHVVNGFGCNSSYLDTSNGVGDLAAQLTWFFKKDNRLGNVYMNPTPPQAQSFCLPDYLPILAEDAKHYGGEFMYVIKLHDIGCIFVSVSRILFDFDEPYQIFDGLPREMADTFKYTDRSRILAHMDELT